MLSPSVEWLTISSNDPLLFAPPLDTVSLAVSLSILSVTVLALVWVEGGDIVSAVNIITLNTVSCGLLDVV